MDIQVPIKDIKTIEDAYQAYIKVFPKKAIFVKSTLFNYFLPCKQLDIPFKRPPSKQVRGAMVKEVWQLANQIRLTDLWEIERVLSWQTELFDSLNASDFIRKPNKHYLKHFLEWCKEQGLLGSPQQETWSVPQSLPSASKAFHQRGGRERNLIVNREPIIEYGADLSLLSVQTKQELEQFSRFWIDKNYEGIRPVPDIIEKSTFEGRIERLSYLIGWLVLDKVDYHKQMCHRARQKKESRENYTSPWLLVDPLPPVWLLDMQREYPPRSLETLVFDDLVPLIEMRTAKLLETLTSNQEIVIEHDNSELLINKIQEELKAQNAKLSFGVVVELSQAIYRNQEFAKEVKKLNQISAKSKLEEDAKSRMEEACKQVRALLKSFFKWLQYQHNPTNDPDGYRISPHYLSSFCDTELNIAKFRYREITNLRQYNDYSDIGLIMEIRNIRREEVNSDFKPNPVSDIKRDPTWKELGFLLKELLVACAPRRKIDSKPDYATMGPMRPQSAVAQDFQKYLVMMFFRIISPDRQHIVRELKQHDSLKLCWINWETRNFEEAPWDKEKKRYKAYYNPFTKLYYLNSLDIKDEKGALVTNPKGKAFSWVVFLDPSHTKIDQDNAYKVAKIYNPELEAWLHGREDFSEIWFNWPPVKGTRNNKWSKKQHHWCGYIDVENDKRMGFRDTFAPTHDFVFTQTNGRPFSVSNMCRFYDAILWRFLGIRSNPHAIRSTAVGHFKRKGMTDAENESLAKLKSHSVKMQDSPTYNRLASLEKTAAASEMIVRDFLAQHNLSLEEYGLVSDNPE